jgi:hypothetical protein
VELDGRVVGLVDRRTRAPLEPLDLCGQRLDLAVELRRRLAGLDCCQLPGAERRQLPLKARDVASASPI